jgi:hypothetical protein
VAIERERIEKVVITTIATFPSTLRARLLGRDGSLLPEPEA